MSVEQTKQKRRVTKLEELLAPPVKVHEIDAPEFGEDAVILVRQLDGLVASQLQDLDEQKKRLGPAWLLAHSLCNEQGELLFSSTQIEDIAKRYSMSFLLRVQDVILKINGMDEASRAAAKNGSSEMVVLPGSTTVSH